jgi:hypothetical protein
LKRSEDEKMTPGSVKWYKSNEATGNGMRTRMVKQQKSGESDWRSVKPMKSCQTCEYENEAV